MWRQRRMRKSAVPIQKIGKSIGPRIANGLGLRDVDAPMTFTRTDLGSLDLNLLNALVALVEERSTVAAARRLGLAQSTVSGTLARLRETFSDELLVRHGRGLEPTSRALELLEACKPHLDGLTAAIVKVSTFDPAVDARIFRLGCTDAVALAILPKLTERLRAEAPHCEMSVRIGDYRVLPSMLASGEVATALAYLRDDPPANAKVRVLRHSPWVVLRNADQPAIQNLADFCARPHALVTPAGDLEGFVDTQLADTSYQRRVVLGVSSFALLLTSLPNTDLITTVPDFVANALVKLGSFEIDRCPVEVPPVTNTLAWGGVSDQDPAEKWFRQALIEGFSQA